MTKKNEIKKSVFDREVKMYVKLYKKKKGCHWGKCSTCGVVPFLFKLHKGILLENKKEIMKLKNKLFVYS